MFSEIFSLIGQVRQFEEKTDQAIQAATLMPNTDWESIITNYIDPFNSLLFEAEDMVNYLYDTWE